MSEAATDGSDLEVLEGPLVGTPLSRHTPGLLSSGVTCSSSQDT